MQTRIVLLLSIALVCAGECVVLEPPQYARVEVLAFSIRGDLIPNPTVELIPFGSGKSFKSEFRDGVAIQIPYGKYTARISAPGFNTAERVFVLAQSGFFLRTQLNVAKECGNEVAGVSGSIQPAPGARELWVKIVPVHGSGGGEVRVSPTGTFQLAGLESGDYLFLVVDGKKIIRTGNVTANGVVNIDLGQR